MFSAVWGRDPPGTKYGFENEVSDNNNLNPMKKFTLTPDSHKDRTLVIEILASRSHSHVFLKSYFSGYNNKDVAFFHKESKTLLEADLLFNLPPYEQVEAIIIQTVLSSYSHASIRGPNHHQ